MNLTDKLIQFDKTEDINLFNTSNKYNIPECWGVCIHLFEWLKLEHKRYLWKQEGKPSSSKPLQLKPESEFARLIPDFVASDDVFRHTLKISNNQLYYSDEISENEIREITKAAFDYYNPERSYN